MQTSHQPYYYNFKQKKRLSQVFLKDYSAVSDVFDDLDLKGKSVLEIGPGEGVITEVLQKKAKKVVAIEIDSELAELLKERFKTSKNVEIICADAMQSSFNYPVVIGFLPYHISSPLLFKLLSSKFKESILCVQKEFALRMVAEPGAPEYSKLSVMAQSKADITYLATVPKEAFSPIPKVDSALVYLVKEEKARLNESLISALFQHKNQSARKALLHSLPQLKLSKEQLLPLFSGADFSKRPRFMNLEELSELSRAYGALFTKKG